MRTAVQTVFPWWLKRGRTPAVAAAILLLGVGASRGETLIFIAQPDPGGTTVDVDWFKGNNWFTFDQTGDQLVHADRVPTITDAADLETDVAITRSVEIASVILNSGLKGLPGRGHILSGELTVDNLTLHGATIDAATVTVRAQMNVVGTVNQVSATLITIQPGAVLLVAPNPPLAGSLALSKGALIFNQGAVILSDGASLTGSGGGAPGSPSGSANDRITVLAAAELSANGTAHLSGINGGLTLDNRGNVKAKAAGTFFVGPGITWTRAQGLGTRGNWVAEVAGSTLDFPGGFLSGSNISNIFKGAGLCRIEAALRVEANSVLNVGIDPATGILDPGALELPDGELDGGGTIRVFGNSMLTLSASAGNSEALLEAFTGSINIDANAQLTLSGNGTKDFRSGTINNAGRTLWTGAGDINMRDAAVFNNESGGLFDLQNDQTLSATGGNGAAVFNNGGVVRKAAGTGASSFGVIFNNASNGTVQVWNAGLAPGQTRRISLSNGTSSGAFSIDPNTTLRFFSGRHTVNPGGVFTGGGFVSVLGGTLVLDTNATVNVANLEVGLNPASGDPGVVDGPGSLVVSRTFNWTGGALQGGGSIDIAAGATATGSAASKTLSHRALNNAGTFGLVTGITLGNGTIINNLAGGVFDLQSDASLSQANNSMFNNAGTFVKSGGAGQSSIGIPFNNTGSVEVRSGTLFLQSYTQTAGQTRLNGGGLKTSSIIQIQGGVLSGAGPIDGNVSNGGTVSPGASPGILTITGNYGQTAAGTLEVEIGGPAPGSQFDQLKVSNNVTLDGGLKVSLINGFAPAAADAFQIIKFGITSGSLTGSFSSASGLHTANGLVLVPRYNNADVTLTAIQDVVLQSPARNGSTFSFQIGTTIGFSYLIEFTDSLNPVNWQVLDTVVGDGTVKPIVDPVATVMQRFYRVRIR